MRPPEFTGGNNKKQRNKVYINLNRFNEAAGIHRRKLDCFEVELEAPKMSFNEAAGIHRRKPSVSTWLMRACADSLQ